jgi:hypothetical protein
MPHLLWGSSAAYTDIFDTVGASEQLADAKIRKIGGRKFAGDTGKRGRRIHVITPFR